jgi:hypothetical protein
MFSSSAGVKKRENAFPGHASGPLMAGLPKTCSPLTGAGNHQKMPLTRKIAKTTVLALSHYRSRKKTTKTTFLTSQPEVFTKPSQLQQKQNRPWLGLFAQCDPGLNPTCCSSYSGVGA